ncbi:mannose-1-phosphate guanylyltransferase/mannose-6-phosphate isomerase [Archaeoglobus veneficus]|uniref:mannose-1-phosphate guanylyltransferase n=1 Tax=Archaeoglobus veneficus (strain DSM 11195 / SNP6) TaxID=693661 RepID=F2KND1_ARCVS|nr:mannose-1-phosphate guanylyltransferase/mannose-6-phosphate isomerase [Archaeoglobus veneficus]AEA47333.1 mannose-1-phosphate guanylyltransferase/mannose-6-phosphate isomerase [Archaeoglobus veneficus SNP6]
MKTVILAGGSGSRLWPLSREQFPKQFVKLFDDSSLFQKTVDRALMLSEPDEVYIVTNAKYEFRVLDQLSEMGLELPEENILIEPEAKNTLPAIFYAIKMIEEKHGDSVVAVLPSDHLIEVNDSYKKAFENAKRIAEKYLVTFGVKPTRPHTGYGYIKPGKPLDGGYEVKKFVEKPDLEKAKEYVGKGYFWNSGMFLFKSSLFIEECRTYQPVVVRLFETESLDSIYKKLPEISIDYAIMEKTDRAAVVPLDTFWSDVGSFDSLYDIFEKDKDGNVIKGECLPINSKNNFILGERLIAPVGVRDLIIVDTKDAVLVCSKRAAQKVKDVVEILKSRGDERGEVHKTAYRPWGSFTVLEEGGFYKIKRLTVLPGRRLSLQRHYHRSEHWVVVKGTARVIVEDRKFLLKSGESTFIDVGKIHRLENPGLTTLEVIEVQIGEYLGEDDIERFQDDFGRDESSATKQI